MNRYLGTKLINATPMNRQEYNDFRGWEVPADENPADEGYLVEYIDGGLVNLNDPDTVAVVGLLELSGLIAPGRAAEILA